MKKFFILFPALCALVMSGCNDFLDRPTKTALTDDTYWKNPENIRLYVNGGYTNYFTGYNSGWSATKATGVYGSPEYSDDATNAGAQADILNAVPADNKVYASSQEGVVQDGTSHGYANGISLLTDLKRIRIAILLKPIITGWVSHASSGHSNTVN